MTDVRTRQATELEWGPLDEKAVDTVRVLAADAVQNAGNGHPGTAISLAPLAYLLFQKVMHRDPSDSTWIGRDRFILSAGHSSLTQYIQFYLGGYGLELEDLEQLRKWGSKTPGHPEYGHTDGVEITTGPLGQGFASSVGFAYASRFERGLFDPDAAPGTSPFDHFVYASRATATSRRASPTRPPRSPARSSSATSSSSTTATRSPSRTTPTSPSPRTRRPGTGARLARAGGRTSSRPTATTRRTSRPCTPRSSRRSPSPTSRPSSWSNTIIGWPSPEAAGHRQDPRLRDGRRGGRGPEARGRLRPGEDLRRRAGGARAHPQGDRARPGAAPRVERAARAVGDREPGAQAAARPHPRRASCPTTRSPTCRSSRPARRSRRASPPAR